jgi:hypothetical protein
MFILARRPPQPNHPTFDALRAFSNQLSAFGKGKTPLLNAKKSRIKNLFALPGLFPHPAVSRFRGCNAGKSKRTGHVEARTLGAASYCFPEEDEG